MELQFDFFELIKTPQKSNATMYVDLDDSEYDYGATDEDEIDRDGDAHVARYMFCCV